LERVPLPDDVSEVLDADLDLAAKIERHLDKAERYRKGLRGQASYMLVVIGVMVVVSLLGYWPVLAITWQAAGLKKVIILLSFLLGAAFMFVPVGVWVVAHRRSIQRRVARVPFAKIRLADRIVPECPSCGSDLEVSGGLTSLCHYCETESLLPATLVSARLQRKHARAVAAHEDVDSAMAEMESAVSQGQVAKGKGW
jgi:hypothetical protein